jgi:hypothetical protein
MWPNASADGQHDHVAEAARGAHLCFAEQRRAGVVVGHGIEARGFAQ